MSAHSRNLVLAKKLVAMSLNEEGRVDEAKVSETLLALRSNPPRDHKGLLREYLRRIEREIAKNVAIVEYAGQPGESALDALRANLAETYDRPVEIELRKDPELLAGLRVTVGDDVYEDSAATRLRPLSSAVA